MAVGASSQRCSVFRFSESTEASRIPLAGMSYASNLNMLRLVETLSIGNCLLFDACSAGSDEFLGLLFQLGDLFVALRRVACHEAEVCH